MTTSRNMIFFTAVVVAICSVAHSADDKTSFNGVLPMPTSTLASVRTLLLEYVNHRQVATPANVFCSTCLIKGWQRSISNAEYIRFPYSALQSALSRYPAQVQKEFQALRFITIGSNKFEDFRFEIENSYALKKSYIGVARRVNDIVDAAILQVDLQADLVTKYITLSRRECKKILFVKKCKTVYFDEPRGYYANEITDMRTALESEAFRLFQRMATQIAA